jgi:SHS family lactate transporter-like MFS transporter
MGGEWAAGMPLALEHLPDRLRGAAAGILQGAWAWGYILSALVFQTLYPVLRAQMDEAWRGMFWLGAIPALFVLWIRSRVSESPLWLALQREAGSRNPAFATATAGSHRSASRVGGQDPADLRRAGSVDRPPLAPSAARPRVSLARIFARDLLGTTIHCSLLAACFMVSYYSVTYWYATFLQRRALNTLPYIVALNVGGILGSAFWGGISEGRLGRRGAVTCAAALGVIASPVYLMSDQPAILLIGALLVGFGAHGMWGAFPSYLTERYPSEVRGAGAGFCYHAGALVGSFTSFAIGHLVDTGWTLPGAMTMSVALSGLAVSLIIWLGPETRGRRF